MPLQIRPLTEDDVMEATQLVVESYKNNPFRMITFPDGMGKASLDRLIQSRMKALDDPDKHALKVIDTETGEIAGTAIWEHTKAMSDDDWDRERDGAMDDYPEARKEILEDFVMQEQDAKRRIKSNKRWWELMALSTLPKYQRRGIGSMLMEWGNTKQEEMQLPGFMVATDQGYGLYIKHGYKEVDRWEADMGRWPQWGGHGMYKNVFLVREPSKRMAF